MNIAWDNAASWLRSWSPRRVRAFVMDARLSIANLAASPVHDCSHGVVAPGGLAVCTPLRCPRHLRESCWRGGTDLGGCWEVAEEQPARCQLIRGESDTAAPRREATVTICATLLANDSSSGRCPFRYR